MRSVDRNFPTHRARFALKGAGPVRPRRRLTVRIWRAAAENGGLVHLSNRALTMSSSILAAVEMAPGDPILGVTEAFNADPTPNKVNLGVGVYYDDNGKVPLLECVRRAERQLVETAPARSYLPIDGLPEYDRAVQALVFGTDSLARKENRIVTVQALGGTGGLKVGADLLRRINPDAQVWISQPSWEN